MKRLLDLPGQQPIGFHRHEHIGGLDADLEVLKVQTVEMIHVTQRGFHQRLRCRLAVLLLQILLQRTGVDADTDRDAFVAGSIDHGTDTIFAADIAWIDTQAIDAEFGHAQGDLIVEVNVGNQRQRHTLLDPAKGFRGFHRRHRDPYDIGAGIGQALDLPDRCVDITGFGVSHALYGNRRIATDRNATHPDLAGLATLDRRFGMHDHCPSLRRAVSPRI